MIAIHSFPRNQDYFARLAIFAQEILDICNELSVTPILDGSLAVFAYTRDQDVDVNDVDLSCPEADFPKIIAALEGKNISYKLREWHVLQILKGDLKIEMGSREYWLKDLPLDLDTLQMDGYAIKILGLNSLKEFYRWGMEDRAKLNTENDRLKYERLKLKYEALTRLDSKPPSAC